MNFEGISFKELAVSAPIFGSALCVLFDVGYFWGIDINFYTAFTLSEHIGFALQASPMIVIVCLVFAIGIAFFFIIRDRLNARAAGKNSNWTGRKTSSATTDKLIWAWLVFMLLVIGYYCYAGEYAWAGVNSVFFLIVLASALRPPKILVGIMGLLLLLFGAIGLGYASGSSYVDRNRAYVIHALNLSDGSSIAGRLIRTGERGVLFFNIVDKRVVLHRWDGVKNVGRI